VAVLVRKVDQMRAELDHLRAENRCSGTTSICLGKDYGKRSTRKSYWPQAVPCSLNEIIAELNSESNAMDRAIHSGFNWMDARRHAPVTRVTRNPIGQDCQTLTDRCKR